MGRLHGKVAVITGGARGQGRSHAIGLAQDGADIAICDVDTGLTTTPYATATAQDLVESEALVSATGRRCLAATVDVRDRDGMRAFVARVASELGSIDIVVANAGIINYAPLWEFTDEQWDEVLDTNLTGVWNTVRACVPHLIDQGRGGSIVLISSTAGLVAVPGSVAYTVSKHGVVGLMRSLAVELGRFGIRANAIHPTSVRTPMVENQATRDLFAGHEGGTAEVQEAISERLNLLPVAFVDPSDVTNAVRYLVSDDARWVTGTSLKVDAGATANPPGNWRGIT